MVEHIRAAQVAARKAIEATYFGTLKVTEMQKVRDTVTGISETKEVVVLEDTPCRLSFETIQSTSQTDVAAELVQITKLFIPPDIRIKEGSKITVIQDGVTKEYAASGTAAVYPTHQEIVLRLFERYA